MDFTIDKKFYRFLPRIDRNELVETKERSMKTKKMESTRKYLIFLN
jgi:hypothetical protein